MVRTDFMWRPSPLRRDGVRFDLYFNGADKRADQLRQHGQNLADVESRHHGAAPEQSVADDVEDLGERRDVDFGSMRPSSLRRWKRLWKASEQNFSVPKKISATRGLRVASMPISTTTRWRDTGSSMK